MENLTINENGTVRIGGEVADYDGLLEILSPIGEYETEEAGTLVLFPFKGGDIELLLDGSFGSGEEANFTDLSFEEIMEYFNVK